MSSFSGGQISRALKTVKGQIAIAMGDAAALRRVVDSQEDQRLEYDLRRLLNQYPPLFVKPLFKQKPPLEVFQEPMKHLDWIFGNADPKHFNYRVLQRMFPGRR